MADPEETNRFSQNNFNGERSTPKVSRFRKSTVIGLGRDQKQSIVAGDESSKSGNSEPVLPMFVQMNVRWDGVDKLWREASR